MIIKIELKTLKTFELFNLANMEDTAKISLDIELTYEKCVDKHCHGKAQYYETSRCCKAEIDASTINIKGIDSDYCRHGPDGSIGLDQILPYLVNLGKFSHQLERMEKTLRKYERREKLYAIQDVCLKYNIPKDIRNVIVSYL